MRNGWSLAVLLGCDGSGGRATGGDLVLRDENNYTYVPTLRIGETLVQSQTDAVVDWSALTMDLRGRPVDPTAIEQVYLVEWRDLTQQEIADKIATNELYGIDIEEGYIFNNAAHATAALLSAFSILGNAFDPGDLVEGGSNVWMVSLMNHPDGANDHLQSKFITPLDPEPNIDFTFTDGCSTLDVEVNVDDPIPPVTPTGRGNVLERGTWSLDWHEVTVDVFGRTFEPQLADTLQIGWFDVTTVAEIESEFLRLDTFASALYTLDVYDSLGVADLSAATDASGAAFPGFTTDGIWLVAIACRSCLSPAPLYLAVVARESREEPSVDRDETHVRAQRSPASFLPVAAIADVARVDCARVNP